jgi:Fur family ferric uptake transcriptional regulator
MMAQDHKDLKKSGLKATLPRLKILSLFEHSDAKHLSAEDVYKLLIKSGEDVGLATVYRVLTQFEQAGLLIRHHFESDKAVFELSDSQHHDHIVCMQCGHVEEFCDDEIEERQKIIANKKGFVIQEHSLYIYAECTKIPCPNKI